MKMVKRLQKFREWIADVDDSVDKAIIAQHIERLQRGIGDVEPVGEGISELRIHKGAGWRIYFIEVEGTIILLLTGGVKNTQTTDIKRAKQIVKDLKAKRTAEQKAAAAAEKRSRNEVKAVAKSGKHKH